MNDWRQDAHKLKASESALSECKENSVKVATASKDLSHDYEKSSSAIDDYYISMLEATCGDVSAANPASRNDGASSAKQSAGLTLKQKRLNDLQASQLVACQQTIKVIYNLNGKGDLLPVD